MSAWQAIPGWEGLYEVSDCGEVRSLDRIATNGHRIQGKMLAVNSRKDGYLMVGFYRGSARKAYTIHRLVLQAFEGPCPDGYEVCHRNGKRDDNRLSNLYYGTRSENNYDKRSHGTDHNARRTHCNNGHAFDAENTYWRKGHGRRCRRCMRAMQSRWASKRKDKP